VHAIDEDVDTNTLSAPHIITLNNQEASILVGERYPILSSMESTQTDFTVSKSLDHYEDIGVQLNVVPQIAGDDFINMVIHPAVTDRGSNVGTDYPIINSREAETRVLVKTGETIVIGGLMQDQVNKSIVGVPFLKDLPFIGKLFTRETTDKLKKELLIFITAKIIKEAMPQEFETARFQQEYSGAAEYNKNSSALPAEPKQAKPK
jgi:general secretion pathway protein D